MGSVIYMKAAGSKIFSLHVHKGYWPWALVSKPTCNYMCYSYFIATFIYMYDYLVFWLR